MNFQFWFRDGMQGGAAVTNTTDAIAIQFVP
jgi:hypothetical protein